MKKIILILIFSISLSSCGGVRLPENYSLILDKAADTNKKIIEKSKSMTNDEKADLYLRLIIEDNKTLKAAAETIRNGGGS